MVIRCSLVAIRGLLNTHINIYIYISGIWQTLLSKATSKEYIC